MKNNISLGVRRIVYHSVWHETMMRSLDFYFFSFCLDWVMRKTNAPSNGIQWSIAFRLDDVDDFADDIDICLLTHVGRDMKIKWNSLCKTNRFKPELR